MTKRQIQDMEDTKTRLREMLPPGSKVYTILRHVSRSGMLRHISVLRSTEGGGVEDISGWVAKALNDRRANDGGIKVGGCGMDMGYHLVMNLSYALHGYDGKGRGKKPHTNTPSGGLTVHPHEANPRNYVAGYSLQHSWI